MENNENTKYWAIINGVRLGPMSLDELVRLAPENATPVWRQGLADWCAASSLPELAGCISTAVPPVPHIPHVPQPPVTPPAYQPHIPQVSAAPMPAAPDPDKVQPMPPTYLAWSIITMLLCCLVPGIVALIYSTKVSSRFNTGDIEGARKASENAAIWIIVTVVCGLIAIPFQFVLALL